jgi:hypothetical protein
LIWEERNSGRYEHARACRERALAPLDEMITQPSPLLYQLKFIRGILYYSRDTRVQLYSSSHGCSTSTTPTSWSVHSCIHRIHIHVTRSTNQYIRGYMY